jgi:hypothetical protein
VALGRLARTEPRGSLRTLREALVVVGVACVVAVGMTWPALRHPTTTLPHDTIDAALMGWEVRWGAYALLHQPAHLFDANAFYPDLHSYAFSDTLFGYWPLGLLGSGPAGAALAVNLIYVLAYLIASVGGYALARQLGAGRVGSAVAGLAMAYAPWRLGQVGHMHVISTGGIMLSLAMLARGHGFSIRSGHRPERHRPAWIVAGWLVAAWQVTIGFGIGLVFIYVLAGIGGTVLVRWWRSGRPRLRRPVVLTDLAGALVLLAVTVFMAVPYLQVVHDHPNARRGEAELAYYSPPLTGFLAGPAQSLPYHDDPLGLRATVPVPSEMALLPGFTLYALALLGLFVSVWPRRWRVGLGIGVLVSVILGVGATLGGRGSPYVLLHNVLPGLDGLRTPGRLIVWTTLLLALLAAGAISALVARVASRSAWAGQAVGVLAAVLVLAEGLSALPQVTVPPAPAALTSAYADAVAAPVLVLPSDQTLDPLVMLWSTDGFPAMVNGLSGFTPSDQARIRAGTYAFPNAASVSLLRGYGVRSVVVLRDRIAGTPWAGAADASIAGLGIQRRAIGDAVVYRLD